MIYETSGRAREYFELAANLYTGCTHGCVYCFGADVLHMEKTQFFTRPAPRKGGNGDQLIEELRRDAAKLAARGEKRHILLSFVTDPYQAIDNHLEVTRRAIQVLKENGLAVAILTKGGLRACRDLSLLDAGDLFGTTLTFLHPLRSRAWEPAAASPTDRITSLQAAHNKGKGTWVSLEPVIDPTETLKVIEVTASFVDHYKVGTLNYANKIPSDYTYPTVDWKNFARNVRILLDHLNKPYYLKKDLARYIGEPDGLAVGDIPK